MPRITLDEDSPLDTSTGSGTNETPLSKSTPSAGEFLPNLPEKSPPEHGSEIGGSGITTQKISIEHSLATIQGLERQEAKQTSAIIVSGETPHNTHSRGEKSRGGPSAYSLPETGNELRMSLSTGSRATITQLQAKPDSPSTSCGSGPCTEGLSQPQKESPSPIETEMPIFGGLEATPTTLDPSIGYASSSITTPLNSSNECSAELNQAQSGKHFITGDSSEILTQRLPVAGSIKRKKKAGRPRNDQKEREFESLKSDKETARAVFEAQALHGKMLGLTHEQTAKAMGCKAYQVKHALKRFEPFFPQLDDVPSYLVSKVQLFNNIEMRLLKSISGKLDDAALRDVVYGFKEVFHANRLENDKSTNNTKSQSQVFTKPQEPPKGSSDN